MRRPRERGKRRLSERGTRDASVRGTRSGQKSEAEPVGNPGEDREAASAERGTIVARQTRLA